MAEFKLEKESFLKQLSRKDAMVVSFAMMIRVITRHIKCC